MESQLSAEQKEICFAPCSGTTLVMGPPGSGKTVVALYRARSLESQDESCHLLVYNKVLRQYTESGDTFLRWLGAWWRQATSRSFPYAFEEPEGGGRSQRVWDYASAVRDARGDQRDALHTKGHWGHVILDEAQDFPPDAHRLLWAVQNLVFSDQEEEDRPSLLILADENQRLTSQNSTINEIRDAHMLTADDTYHLKKNYRNSREIAQFAQQFYVGLPSGQPELPEARGEKPSVVMTEDLDEAVTRIVRYARAHEDQEIGVFVFYDRTRKKLFNKIAHHLRDTPIIVQTYGSRDKDHKDASKLRFESGGGISVICFASAKGLEFDTVFLPELQSFPVSADRKDEARMNLYVMCSRARTRLFLMASDRRQQHEIWDIIRVDPELCRLEA